MLTQVGHTKQQRISSHRLSDADLRHIKMGRASMVGGRYITKQWCGQGYGGHTAIAGNGILSRHQGCAVFIIGHLPVC